MVLKPMTLLLFAVAERHWCSRNHTNQILSRQLTAEDSLAVGEDSLAMGAKTTLMVMRVLVSA